MSDNQYHDGSFMAWASAGFTAILGAIGYLYKDYTGKQQRDVTLKESTAKLRAIENATAEATITRLNKEIERITSAYEKLIIVSDKQVTAIEEVTKDKESTLKELNDIKIQIQKLNNELAFYKIKK